MEILLYGNSIIIFGLFSETIHDDESFPRVTKHILKTHLLLSVFSSLEYQADYSPSEMLLLLQVFLP